MPCTARFQGPRLSGKYTRKPCAGRRRLAETESTEDIDVARLIRRAWRLLRDSGPRVFASRVFRKFAAMLAVEPQAWLVGAEDAAAVDWTVRPEPLQHPIVIESGPAEIAWISSPPGAESGGHQNLFRFIKFAEDAGHRCTVYLYDHHSGLSIESVRSVLASTSAYPDLAARIVRYDPDRGVAPGTHAIFATGWETAYPSYRDTSHARRFYFVQDFEPAFYPVGSEYVLAENTYRFGFHGITAGRWLATRLRDEYGMSTDSYDFAVNRDLYHVVEGAERSEVFFYARPVTARRAFEFGMLALADFHSLRPDVPINLAGWDVRGYDIPFPHRNLSSLDVTELNGLYNRCAAGLVLSLTNMSLLPLELMSSGVVPLVNDAPNNRLVSDNEHIEWVELSPFAIARRLARVVDRPDRDVHARRISESVGTHTWEDSGRDFVAAFERVMRG